METNNSSYRRCVGIMLLNAENKVWVGRRIDAPEGIKENWAGWAQMPQGGIDEGEEPAAAAKRELHEETSVTSADIIAEAPNWLSYDFPPERQSSTTFCGQSQKWFAMRFSGDESEIDISAPEGHDPEFGDWGWVSMDELTDLIVPFKRQVYTEVVSAFAHLDT